MSFISPSDHEKFIKLFESSVSGEGESFIDIADEKTEMLKADIDQLQTIAQKYKNTISQLQELGREYKIIFQRAKVNLRKQQIKQNPKRNRYVRN
ncbi:MAG: hypothetical protein ABIR18_16165 [Chitinophagaceae bacterium]